LLEAIAKRRGCHDEGQPGREKAARILLTDYRSGALGRISLERPGDEYVKK
jgi:ribosome biogenesis GTPase A